MATTRLLSKGHLCLIFGLYSQKSNRKYYHRLKDQYFTKEALGLLNISEQRYNSITGFSTFNFQESKAIIKHFDIREEELTLSSQ